MADLRKLKDKAAELAAKGKLERAAEVYRELLGEDPRDVASRQKLAEVLRRAGEVPQAVEAYAQVAERFARDGLLIKAIAICKTILELDPRHQATQRTLADLYGRRAAADGAPPAPRTVFLPAAAPREAPVVPATSGLPPELDLDLGVAIPLGPAATAGGPARPSPPPEAEERTLELSVEGELPAAEPAAPDADPFGGLLERREDPFARPAPPLAPRAPAQPIELDALPEVPAPEPTGFTRIMAAASQARTTGVIEAIEVDADVPDDFEPVLGEAPLARAGGADPELVELAPTPAPRTTPPPAAARAAPPPRAATARPLPRVALFSDLGPEAFVALAEGVVLHRHVAGERVLREGETGTSFYVVASGRFAVSKRDEGGEPVVLAHLGEGDFFGEMALLSGAPRAATVTAEGPGEVLEVPTAVLQSIAARHPHLAGSLGKFYRQRLLANALAVSPIFRPFGRGERKLIMERFRAREVAAGEVVVREGERSDGLYVILEGAVDVTKRRGGTVVLAGRLAEGDLFGEVSCLRKTAATATVTARRGGTFLRLPRADFDELVMRYPQILELVSTLSEERLEALDAIMTGAAEFTEDGLVLI
jgi:CRP-like cAMP-binding protein